MKCAKCANVWLAFALEQTNDGQQLEKSSPNLSEPLVEQQSDTAEDGWDEDQWHEDLAADFAADESNSANSNVATVPETDRYETINESSQASPRLATLRKEIQDKLSVFVRAMQRSWDWLRRLRLREQIAVLAGLVMPFALVGGIYSARDTLVRQFPDLASLYETVGVEVNLEGLVFDDVRTIRRPENDVAVLVVEGVIRNITSREKSVPRLHFILSGRSREVYSWQDEATMQKLSAGESIEFRTVLASPPDVADQLHVRFLNNDTRLNRL